MTDICCIGHITHDEIITPQGVTHLPGGTSWYFSHAISQMDIAYQLITAVGAEEQHFVTALENRKVQVVCFKSRHTIHFVNQYHGNGDHRTQKVLQKSDPFTAEQLESTDAAIVHVGTLVADDIPEEAIPAMAVKARISLDVQGYLRDIEGEAVVPARWEKAALTLPFIYYLKVNEEELEVLTGCTDIQAGAKKLGDAGVKEVIVTLGSQGSVILNDGIFYTIPAYLPGAVVDATGCGDTYMAGYLYKRSKGASIDEAGRFAAAMATLKIGLSGAFTGTEEEVNAVLTRPDAAF